MATQSTPLATDPYGRFMASVFDDRMVISVPTAFQAFFGNPGTGANTVYSPDSLVVEIDIIRGNEKLAALVQRGTNSRILSGQDNVNEQKYSSFSRLYPLIEEEGDLNSHQINFRVAGENPYQAQTRIDRLRTLALNQHTEIVRRIVRLFEYLCSQSVLTGQMPAIFGTTNSDLIYDFLRKATHTFAAPVAWNNSSNDILGDIDTACDLIRADAHVNPDMMILGGETMEAMVKDTTVQEVADNRRFELIEVSTNNPVPPKFARFTDAGFIARGRLRTPKGYELWMFTYVDGYTSSAGAFTNYMPQDNVLIAYSQARCDRYFGPPETLPMTAQRAAFYQEMFGFSPMAPPMPPMIKNEGQAINPAMFYYDAYSSPNYKEVTLRTQSAPIFATTMTDAFVTITGTVV